MVLCITPLHIRHIPEILKQLEYYLHPSDLVQNYHGNKNKNFIKWTNNFSSSVMKMNLTVVKNIYENNSCIIWILCSIYWLLFVNTLSSILFCHNFSPCSELNTTDALIFYSEAVLFYGFYLFWYGMHYNILSCYALCNNHNNHKNVEQETQPMQWYTWVSFYLNNSLF